MPWLVFPGNESDAVELLLLIGELLRVQDQVVLPVVPPHVAARLTAPPVLGSALGLAVAKQLVGAPGVLLVAQLSVKLPPPLSTSENEVHPGRFIETLAANAGSAPVSKDAAAKPAASRL